MLARLFRPRASLFLPPAPSLRSLEVAGRQVPVVVARNARARRSIVRADAVSGTVRVTLPLRAPAGLAATMLAEHLDWIAARVGEWPRPLAFAHGARIPLGDGSLVLDCDPVRRPGVQRVGEFLMVGGPIESHRHRAERWLRAEALRTLRAATLVLAAEIAPSAVRVGVRDPRSRWGSCSSDGAITYSWRLVFAPAWIQHSVVAHEVAHLVHPDHGAAFWKLAAVLNRGDPTAARRWLRAHGPALHWIGRAS